MGVETVLLVIHLMIALALVGVVLLQKSEGGGLGFGGGSLGGVVSVRGTANLLTRATSVLATAFICMSLLLAIVAANRSAPDAIVTPEIQSLGDSLSGESLPELPPLGADESPVVPQGD